MIRVKVIITIIIIVNNAIIKIIMKKIIKA